MGKMDDFEITGFVSASEFGGMKILDPRCRELWEKIIQGLKDKPEALPVIGQPLKTKAEARKKSRFLMGQKRLMGSAYDCYGISISGNDEIGYRLIGVPVKAGKKKGKGKGSADKQAKEAMKAANEENNRKVAEVARNVQDKQVETWLHQKDVLEHPEKYPDEYRGLEQALKVQGKNKEQMLAILNAGLQQAKGIKGQDSTADTRS
jgi:hypothetical protein